jgi:hypothetical protein
MPIVFEPPAALLAAQSAGSLGSPADGSGLASSGNLQIWIAASPANGDPLWGGCQVWLSFDGTTYNQIGTITAAANQGVLTADLAAPPGSNPDTADTLAVDLAMSEGALPAGSDDDAANGRTLAFVDGELMAFGLATPTTGNAYALSYLFRALYGSCGSSHASGADFVFLDDAAFKYNLPSGYVGRELYFKFPSFNLWGGGLEDLADLTPTTYTPTGAGFAFSNSNFMSLLYQGATLSLGDIGSAVAGNFACGDIGGCAGETLQLGSL